MHPRIAITGIHTGIGKTISSAVLAESLDADYWKPVQAGNLDDSDSIQVRKLITNGGKRVHPENIMLTAAMSPHAAAAIDSITVDFTTFDWPETDKTLLVETAGGILSPMSDTTTMADFLQHYQLPTILISNNYLGSINHTLMSIEVLRSRNIELLGLVMNGDEYPSSEHFITSYGKVPIIARIPQFSILDNEAITACAAEIRSSLLKHLS